MKRKVVILSLDGGGIRGIIPGVILAYIEQGLRNRAGDDRRLADYFDLVAGTSTGGILGALYLTPSADEPFRPGYTADEAVNLYFEQGPSIFSRKFWQKVESLGGVSDEKYDVSAFKTALNRYFGESRLSQMLKPCLITAYDLERRKAVFFTSREAARADDRDYWMRDVVLATSSAPTYFEPALVRSLAGSEHALIDGGVFANNPTLCAYAEARKMSFENIGKAENPCVEDMLILSIGAGGKSMAEKKPYPYDRMKDAGKLKWISPLIDIMMSGNAETVDFQTRQIFDTLSGRGPEDYHRLEPGIGQASPEMDDARPDNMAALRAAGQEFVEQNKPELDAIVEKLIAHRVAAIV